MPYTPVRWLALSPQDVRFEVGSPTERGYPHPQRWANPGRFQFRSI